MSLTNESINIKYQTTPLSNSTLKELSSVFHYEPLENNNFPNLIIPQTPFSNPINTPYSNQFVQQHESPYPNLDLLSFNNEESLKGMIELSKEKSKLLKQTELNAKVELQEAQSALLEQYHQRENELKAIIENQRIEFNEELSRNKEIIESKNIEISNLKLQHSQLLEKNKEKQAEYILMLGETEKKYEERIAEIIKSHEAEKKDLAFKKIEEKNRLELALQAKQEVLEEKIKKKYEKKMNFYISQIEAATKKLADKENYYKGSLEEARHEIASLRARSDAKIELQREELLIKDKRFLQLEDYIQKADEIYEKFRQWRSISDDISALVIRACSTTEFLEDIIAQIKKSYEDKLQEMQKDSLSSFFENGSNKKSIDIGLDSSNNSVVLDKKLMQRCLKLSKEIQDRLKYEKIPPKV